jgi:hypothetical protein
VVIRRRKTFKKSKEKTIIVEKLYTGVSIHFFSSLSHLDFKLEIPTSNYEILMRRLLPTIGSSRTIQLEHFPHQ